MKPTLILACCESKLDHAAKPVDLYQSRAWKLAREAWPAEYPLLALSAEYGLIDARGAEIEPYERKLNGIAAQEMLQSPTFRKQAAELLGGGSGPVYVHGGLTYRDVIANVAGVRYRALIGQNRGCGDHYSALVDLVGEVAIMAKAVELGLQPDPRDFDVYMGAAGLVSTMVLAGIDSTRRELVYRYIAGVDTADPSDRNSVAECAGLLRDLRELDAEVQQ